MKRNQSIRLEPMTAEAFAPFGWVIDAPEQPSNERPLFPVEFECDGRTTIHTIWQPCNARGFSRLERHFGVTQTFFQLSGPPSVVCVAPTTDLEDPAAIPHPSEVRGFLIDPHKGFSFARGTWHSLDRYVLAAPGATFVILNVDPNPTQIVDYASGESVFYEDLASNEPSRSETLEGEFGLQFTLAL